MRPYILEKTTWKEVKKYKYEVAVIPWGATEPHNFHLPYGTDSLETGKIAEESAKIAWEKGARIMILPTIPLGLQNPGQVDIPFCLNTSVKTQRLILKDIITSLSKQGIRKIIILNGHGGNNFKPILRGFSVKFPKIFLGVIEWFRLFDLSKYFEEKCDHAGEMETSIFLHYFPKLVNMKDAGDGKSKKFTINSMKKKVLWTPRDWMKVSSDTGVGYPKKASKEKGKKFLTDLTDSISKSLIELSNCKVEDLYEK